ncbi:LCP family protein [Streptomyces sp. LP05-1]|uniref:LCP family protein n=1 Tax=Streptomyces pyxinae TaxID=2970734 RepID=A0ABT2CA60_9ACTN|nr:LCP family protein [Streptomyces sp. LP05-1]MCS0634238.1 LCP family protein [Streptomyces sp. LP05-1]
MADQGSSRIRATGRRRRGRAPKNKKVTVAAWAATGLVLAGGAGLGYVYLSLNGNIQSVDINAQLKDDDRPQDIDNGSMDVLVLGSDTRSGANSSYGRDEGAARSDTAMILHVYEGHKKASVVSIPRDTIVQRPECPTPDGGTAPARHRAMFNTAFETGGPACAVKTVEQMSGIRMDHYIEVDFSGFKKFIDDLGGVEITTTKPIDDKKSHLTLPAGTHTLDGEQSLGLVRTRKSVGDGSDLGRIQLQQAFMKAFIEQVKSVGIFTNPKKLLDIADSATKAIKPDSELNSVNELASFGRGLSGLGAKDVHMVTLPVQYDPSDPNRVVPLQAKAEQVWQALRADKPIPASATKDTASGQAEGLVR